MRILHAFGWTLTSLVLKYALKLVGNLVLARLLSPGDFGVAAIVFSIISGVEALSDAGVRPAVLRSPRTDMTWLNTAWTLQLARGVLVAIVIAAIAPVIAYSLGRPELQFMISVAGLMTLVTSLSSASILMALRNLDLFRFSISEIISTLFGYAVMLFWAFVSPTAWSLLIGGLATAGCMTVLSYLLLPSFKHQLMLDKESGRELLSFGKWVFLGTALGFAMMQGDRIVTAYVLGLEDLGIYFVAVTWALALQQLIGMVLSRLYLPIASELRRSATEPAKKSSRLRGWILTALLIPLAFGSAGSPYLLSLVYPSSFALAGTVLAVLVIGTWLAIIDGLLTDEMLAAGKPYSRVVAQLISAVFAALALLLYPWDLNVTVIAILFVLTTALRVITVGGMIYGPRAVATSPEIVLSVAVVALAWMFSRFMDFALPYFGGLYLLLATGIAVTAVALPVFWVMMKKIIHEPNRL